MSDLVGDKAVLVVDDRPLSRAMLAEFLAQWAHERNLTVIQTSVEGVVSLGSSWAGAIVLLSIGSADLLEDPRLEAAQLVLTADRPECPIVIVGDCSHHSSIETALRRGVAGYVSTSLEPEIVLAALSFILAGGTYFPADAINAITQPSGHVPPGLPIEPELSTEEETLWPSAPAPGGGSDGPVGRQQPQARFGPERSDLTTRQRQVLGCLESGKSNKEIARQLHVSEATVKVHMRQVMKKLGALNRTQAAVLASREVASLCALDAVV